MPFGDTAKKIQRVTDLAEELYKKVNHLVQQLGELRERVESTSDQLDTMDRELAEQRAIVEALAAEQGIDVDEVVATVETADTAEDGTVDDESGDAAPSEGTDAAMDGDDSASSGAAADDSAADGSAADGSTTDEFPGGERSSGGD